MKISKNNVSLPEKLSDYVVNMSPEESGELRVLVFILASGEGIDTAEIADKLGMPETEVVQAVSFWRGMGLVNVGKKTAVKAEKDNLIEKKPEVSPSHRDTDTRYHKSVIIARETCNFFENNAKICAEFT